MIFDGLVRLEQVSCCPIPTMSTYAFTMDQQIEFLSLLCEKHRLDLTDVMLLWDSYLGMISMNKAAEAAGGSTKAAEAAPTPTPAATSGSKKKAKAQTTETSGDKSKEITLERVNDPTLTKEMLVAMCEAKGLKKSGKKDELVARLIDHLKKPIDEAAAVPAPVGTSKKKVISSAPSDEKKDTPPVLHKFKKNDNEIVIKKNKFGNYEHMATCLLFNEDKKVFGVQRENGEIAELTDDDIEACKQYKFAYVVPKNLNLSKELRTTELDELNEELDDEDIEDELDDEVEEGDDDSDEPADDHEE